MSWSIDGILAALQDEFSGGEHDLEPCGPAILQLLKQSLATMILTGCQPLLCSSPPTALADDINSLFTLAEQYINCVPYNLVQRHWLRLYTDASLLRCIYDLIFMIDKCTVPQSAALGIQGVRRLDMAIVVAGAIGEHRAAWVQATIRKIQECFLPSGQKSTDEGEGQCITHIQPHHNVTITHTSSDLCSLRPVSGSSPSLLFAQSSIPILSRPPSITEYLDKHCEYPFIIKGYLSDTSNHGLPTWPAVQKWSSAEYLLRTVGAGRVVPVEIGKSYDDSGWGQQVIPLESFLSRAGYAVTPPRTGGHIGLGVPADPLYLAQYGLFDQFPELAQDMSYPDYVWSSPPPPKIYPTYQPPPTDDGVIVNVWVGSGGCEIVSPAHTDPYYNCYGQVLGCKRVWLAPPSCGPGMYTYGLDDSKRSDVQSLIDPEGSTLGDQYMTNTSKVPVLRPTDNVKAALKDYPDFLEKVWPLSMEAVLEPGDLMVMPPGWWHAMRGEGEGPIWSVSMWY